MNSFPNNKNNKRMSYQSDRNTAVSSRLSQFSLSSSLTTVLQEAHLLGAWCQDENPTDFETQRGRDIDDTITYHSLDPHDTNLRAALEAIYEDGFDWRFSNPPPTDLPEKPPR
jgi:hypothetical protein